MLLSAFVESLPALDLNPSDNYVAFNERLKNSKTTNKYQNLHNLVEQPSTYVDSFM